MTNKDILTTLESRIFALFSGDEYKDVFLLPLYQDSNPDKKKIFIQRNVAFGDVDTGELGKKGLSPRTSVYVIALSALNGTYMRRMLELTDYLEKSFRRVDIPSAKNDGRNGYGGCGGYEIHCGDPYTTIVGLTQDGRVSVSISVPFATWTGNN